MKLYCCKRCKKVTKNPCQQPSCIANRDNEIYDDLSPNHRPILTPFFQPDPFNFQNFITLPINTYNHLPQKIREGVGKNLALCLTDIVENPGWESFYKLLLAPFFLMQSPLGGEKSIL